MKKKVFISIVTATYNREEYLKDLYKSLKNQTYKNFEWIVGNDGSQDGTDKLIKSFIKEKKIKIKYVSSNIRIGKTKIDNIIIHLAKGKYQCYCGSDDYFKPSALKNMVKLLSTIPKKYENKFGGIISQCVNENNISQSFYKNKKPNSNLLMKWDEIYKYIKGDCTVLEKSKSYKNKKFLEVDFLISESTLIRKIHTNKIFLLSPLITKVMRRTKDSISFGKTMRFTRGYAYSIAINSKYSVFKNLSLTKRIITVSNYWRYCFHGDLNFLKAKKMWEVTRIKNTYMFCIFLTFVYVLWDLITKKIEKTHIEFNKNKLKAKINYYN